MKYRVNTLTFVFTFLICLVIVPSVGPAQAWASQSVQPHYLPTIPKSLTLCGEPVPLDQDFVAEQLDREFNISVHDEAQVVMWLKRAARYFPYISEQLKEAGLPDDLKYLAVAESALLPKVRSHAGAVGLWQFVRGTGRRYKLRRNRYFDDRHNPQKATRAAVAYLKDLHEMFGNWALAMAAYNCGERRVRNAIKDQGSKNYYHLYLPRETMRYVFRIMAIKIIIQDPKSFGYALPESQLYKPRPTKTVTVSLKRSAHLRDIAKAAGTSVRMMRELNPELRGMRIPKGRHRLQVPPGSDFNLPKKLELALNKAAPQPESSRYVVQRGDTLSSIARKNGVKIRDLKKANRLRGSVIKPGQKLIIPGK